MNREFELHQSSQCDLSNFRQCIQLASLEIFGEIKLCFLRLTHQDCEYIFSRAENRFAGLVYLSLHKHCWKLGLHVCNSATTKNVSSVKGAVLYLLSLLFYNWGDRLATQH